jgi:hypothetical protein
MDERISQGGVNQPVNREKVAKIVRLSSVLRV